MVFLQELAELEVQTTSSSILSRRQLVSTHYIIIALIIVVAKSRLTRRQMSMSRKNTQKFSSISNFASGGAYGDDCGSREH